MLILILLIFILISFLIIRGSKENALGYIPYYSRKLLKNKTPYTNSRDPCTLINLKLGQRKLLISELEFFIENLKENDVVVYAGSAPGSHSAIWPTLYKNKFIFYDPNKFDPGLEGIELHQEYFTEEICRELRKAHKSIIFLSDIRTGSSTENVAFDMELQKKWCDILKPRMAMLKFRLPWKSGKTHYYSGDIYLQVREPNNSTETRLWTNCKKMITYDNDDYNDRLFYFQNHARMAFHDFSKIPNYKKSELPNIAGIDHCYDCWAETLIYSKLKMPLEDVFALVDKYTKQPLNVPPHGLEPENKDIADKIDRLCNITMAHEREHREAESKRDVFRKVLTQAVIAYNKFLEIRDVIRSDTKFIDLKLPTNKLYAPDESLKNKLKIRGLKSFEDTYYHSPERAVMLTLIEFITEFNIKEIIINTSYYDQQVANACLLFPDTKFYVYYAVKYTQNRIDNLVFMNKKLSGGEFDILPKNIYYYDTHEDHRDVLKPKKSYMWVPAKCVPGDFRPLPYIDKKELIMGGVPSSDKCKDMSENLFYFNIYNRDAFWPDSCGDSCYSCFRETQALKKLNIKVNEFMFAEDNYHNIVLDPPHLLMITNNTYNRLCSLEPITKRTRTVKINSLNQ